MTMVYGATQHEELSFVPHHVRVRTIDAVCEMPVEWPHDSEEDSDDSSSGFFLYELENHLSQEDYAAIPISQVPEIEFKFMEHHIPLEHNAVPTSDIPEMESEEPSPFPIGINPAAEEDNVGNNSVTQTTPRCRCVPSKPHIIAHKYDPKALPMKSSLKKFPSDRSLSSETEIGANNSLSSPTTCQGGFTPLMRQNSVSFASLEIREYDLTLGDHPLCSHGPPVTLTWDAKKSTVVDIEEYEVARDPRRSHMQMFMNESERRQRLRNDHGCVMVKMQCAINKIKRSQKKNERLNELADIGVEGLGAMFESVKRTTTRVGLNLSESQ